METGVLLVGINSDFINFSLLVLMSPILSNGPDDARAIPVLPRGAAGVVINNIVRGPGAVVGVGVVGLGVVDGPWVEGVVGLKKLWHVAQQETF